MKTKLPILLAASLLSFGLPALAQDAPPTAPPAASSTPAPVLDSRATAILHKCSDFYAGMNSFACTLDGKIHVEAEGQKDENEAVFDIKVQRPDHFSMTAKSGRMMGSAKANGKKLYVYTPALGSSGMYEALVAPDSLPEMFQKPDLSLVSGGMSGLSLLEAFVSKDPYASLMSGVTQVALVGKEDVEGHPTQHLHFRQSDVSWDLWIDDGDQPWVRKVVPDITNILAKIKETAQKDVKMSMTIVYKDTTKTPIIASNEFEFSPPSGAKEVPSFFGLGPAEARSQLMRRPAPEVSLKTLDGGKFDLASFKGKNIIVLGFCTTWAPPCVQSITTMSELAQEYAGKGVRFYAVDVKEEPSKIKEFIATNKLNVNMVVDPDGDAAAALGVSGVPQTIIIDSDGIVRDVLIGFDDDTKEKLADQFDIILAGKSSTN